MKTKYTLLLSTLFLGILTYQYSIKNTIVPSTESHEKPPSTPHNWMAQQRIYPHGKIDRQAKKAALKYRKQALNAARPKNFLNEWEFRGPTNIGGRITDIEMRSDDIQLIYAATASGGIFRLGGGNADWEPIFDQAESLSIGDMAIAPSNEDIIYVGTGEANGGGGSLTYDGYGVYKSLDGGDSWEHLGLEDIGSVGRVAVNPQDANEVFVGAMGDLFGNNTDRGLYRTQDGGSTWQQVLYVSDSTGVIDVVINPSNPELIFAATWERTRVPNERQYGGETSDIYRSQDGGDSWEKLGGQLPLNPIFKGRIGLAIAPSNPSTIYATYAQSDGNILGVFKSTDNGDNWTYVLENGITNVPFMWWFGRIVVDPNDENTLYHIGLHVEKSTDGGKNWFPFKSGIHVDQHSVFVHPMDSDLIVTGNDGGVYITTDGGNVVYKFQDMPITQFYTCEIDDSNPQILYGGSQDNGTNRTPSGAQNDWEQVFGGDGFHALVDPNNSNYLYVEYQYGNIFRSTNGGDSFFEGTNGIASNDRKNWNTPLEFDPNNTNTLYTATHRVYRSTNRAVSWAAISPDLTNGNQSQNITYGTVTSVSVSPLNSNIIYAGTDDGNAWQTSDGGNNWEKISATLPDRWVTRIAADPNNEDAVYITFSGYRFNENMGHIYYSDDRGTTWTNIGSSLPDVPVNDIFINPRFDVDDLYLATDIGVFVSDDLGNTWQILGNELPNVVVTDLDYHAATSTLVAATYGRSMYSYQFDYEVSTEELTLLQKTLQIYPNPASEKITIQFDKEHSAPHQIELFDVNGRLVKSIFKGRLQQENVELETDISALSSGTYFIKVQVKGQTFSKQLIKK